MKKFLFMFLAVPLMLLAGCDQAITRNFGGTTEIKLFPNQKLVNATWKDNNLWYLTRAMGDTDKPERVIFQESSAVGVMQGKVIFIETR